MAAIENTRTAFGFAPVANRLRSLFDAQLSAILAWNDARVTRNSLNTLTDRELEDIGLSRGDIDGVATRF